MNEHIDKINELETIINDLVNELKDLQKSSEVYKETRESLSQYSDHLSSLLENFNNMITVSSDLSASMGEFIQNVESQFKLLQKDQELLNSKFELQETNLKNFDNQLKKSNELLNEKLIEMELAWIKQNRLIKDKFKYLYYGLSPVFLFVIISLIVLISISR